MLNPHTLHRIFLQTVPPFYPLQELPRSHPNYGVLLHLRNHPNTTLDEPYFLFLLEGYTAHPSEKHRIISSIPDLSQLEIDELIQRLENERFHIHETLKKDPTKAISLLHWETRRVREWREIAASYPTRRP